MNKNIKFFKKFISIIFVLIVLSSLSMVIKIVYANPSSFGYDTKGGSETTSGANYIRGSWFTCLEVGQADSITMYLKYASSVKIKYAIYKKSDNSLIGYTEEWTVTAGWDDWKTLNIIFGGVLEASTDYWLVHWTTGSVLVYRDAEVDKAMYDSETYNGFPDPFSPSLFGQKYSVYCNYSIPVNAVPENDQGSIVDMDDTNNIYAQIFGGYTIDYDGHDDDGYANITYILVNLTQATTIRASFKYNEDTNTFSQIDGITGFGIVLGSCSATRSLNNINLTIAFVVKFGAIEENDLELKGYISDGTDNSTDTLQTNYVDVITSLVNTFSINDDRGNINQPIISSGLITYSGSALYPPDAEFNSVSVYDSSNNNEGTDNTILNGAWSIFFNAPNTVGIDTYNLYIDMVDVDYVDGEKPTSDTFITDRYIVVFLSVNNTNPDVNETVLILAQVESEYDSHVLGFADELTLEDKDGIKYSMSYNGTYWNITSSESEDITRIIDTYNSMTEVNFGITILNMDGYLLVIAWGEGGAEGVITFTGVGFFIASLILIPILVILMLRRKRR